MRPYVPREDPTQTSAAPTGVETLPPEDPEDVLARLQRTERRKKAVVVVLSLAALMIGVAVMLDRGLLANPNGFSAFDDVELPEVPDLGETWVGKAIDEAKQARAAESSPRGQMRPLSDEKRAAKPREGRSQDPAPSTDPTASAEVEDTQQARRREPTAAPTPPTRQASRATTRAATSSEASSASSQEKKAQQATGTRTEARPSTPAKDAPQRRAAQAPTGSTTGSSAGTEAKGSTPSAALTPGKTPSEDTEVTVISPTDGALPEKHSGVIEIAQADEAHAEDEGFLVEAAVDPEQYRPRRPWPTPTGRPPATGSVGHFTLVTLPSAEVRFREHVLGTTPLHGQQLPSGRQRLILTGPDGVRRVLILDIHADQTAEVQLPISRLMPEALMP